MSPKQVEDTLFNVVRQTDAETAVPVLINRHHLMELLTAAKPKIELNMAEMAAILRSMADKLEFGQNVIALHRDYEPSQDLGENSGFYGN
jgi:hypothetical protein